MRAGLAPGPLYLWGADVRLEDGQTIRRD